MPGKGSPEFIALMKKCIDIYYKKNHDYSHEGNPFSNFERTAEIVSWFSNPIDQTFMSLIGIKIARLAELCNGTIPNNESIDDSFVDLTNYSALWGAFKIRSRQPQTTEEKPYGPEMLTSLEKVIQEELERQARVESAGAGVHHHFPSSIDPENRPAHQILPVICTECEKVKDNPYWSLRHATEFHSAILNEAQKTLKYPGRNLILLTPDFIREAHRVGAKVEDAKLRSR